MAKCSKFCSENMATPIDVVVFKCRKKISDGKSVKSYVIYRTKNKQNFGFLSNCRYCADHAQNLPEPAPPPTFGSHYSRFLPNRFTFGGVIAERVKAVLFPHRVFS